MGDTNINTDFTKEIWFFKYWRPAIAWCYLFLIMFDFFVCPCGVYLYAWLTHTPLIIWDPITLKGGAILHISLGSISGITAWSRGQEKMASMDRDDH